VKKKRKAETAVSMLVAEAPMDLIPKVLINDP
jgi:hypothetical protein